MTRRWRAVVLVLVGIGGLAAAGCGTPLGLVSGTVTFQGRPVPLAEVTFEARGEPGHQAFATTGEGGRYTLAYPNGKGLVPGRYGVKVTRHTLPDGRPLPPGEQGSALLAEDGKTVSRHYYFEVEVTAGANTHDFELTRGRDRPPGG